jgi:hypothetical protein
MLVFYIYMTNYKKLFKTKVLKIFTNTFALYDVLIYNTILDKINFKHLKCTKAGTAMQNNPELMFSL